MGVGGFLNDLGEGAEAALDKGKEAVGEGIERAGGATAGALDAVGWKSGAEAVRDGSESVANRMGADVAERELGETEDPKELIHGSPDKLEERAGNLKRFSGAFERVGQGMRGLDAGDWQGEAADRFREKFEVQPKQWLKAADACEDASRALKTYAATVSWAQGQAREAIDRWKEAEKRSEQARNSHNADVDAYNAKAEEYNAASEAGKDPGPKPTKPGDFTDPGNEGREAARHLLAEARTQRGSAAQDAARAVAEAREQAPAKPSFLDRGQQLALDGVVSSQLGQMHLAGGFVKGLADVGKLVRTVNPMDPYNLTHPGQWLSNSQMVLSGLVSTAAHPERLPKAIIGSGWGSDPHEATGTLLSNLVGAKGAGGVAKGAARSGARAGAKGAARNSLDGIRNTLDKIRESLRKDTCQDPVDVATGRMILPQTDVRLPALLPLDFSRTFESSYRSGGWFGQCWASTVDQRLEIDAEGVVLVAEDGSLLPFPHPAVGVPTLPEEGRRRWRLELSAHGDYTVTDPESGRVWHFDPPAADLGGDGVAPLSQITDRTTQWLTFERDAQGVPLAVEHSAGYRLEFDTDENRNRITALRLAGVPEPLVRYGYDDNGHLASVTNSSGRPTEFTNDTEGRMLAWRDSNGSAFSYVYDEQHRCTYQSGQDGHLRSTFRYEELADGQRATAVTDSLGHTTRYLTDLRCRLVEQTDPTGATTRTTYDEHDRPLTVTDPLGRVTSYAYDEAGRPVMVVRPDGHYTSVGRDGEGRPVIVAGPEGVQARLEWDAHGNRTAVTDASGATTRFTYTATGHLAAVTDALGHATTVTTDRAGLPLTITDPLGATTTYQRDAFGRPVRLTDPLGHVTALTWTPEGKPASRTGPDGATERWEYDGEGNCLRHTDPLGAVTAYEYTHFDLLAARTDPDGVRHEFRHDTELRLTQVTNPQGLHWSYTYDPAGRLVGETDFDDRTVSYELDAAGALRTRTDALGLTIGFDRDALGRVTRQNADGAVTTYTYDLTGALVRAAGPEATVDLERDAAGRVLRETTDGRALLHEYDILGRRIRRVTPSGAETTYAYDAAGNRTGLTTNGRALDFTHDAAGRETGRRVGASVSMAQLWDPAGRLAEQTVQAAAGPVQHRAYTYRADGALTGLTDRLNGPSSFDLDAAGRVTTVRARDWTESYAYDEAGNQTRADWPDRHAASAARGERTYTGTRIGSAGRIRYEHDAAGRMVLRQKTRLSAKPDTWRYEWDAEDRLCAVTTPDGTRWRYVYDPLGRRTAKLRLAPDGTTVTERTDFTWDGPTLVEQTDTSTGITLTWDHDGFTPLTQTERVTDTTTQAEIDSRFFAIVTDLVGTPTELLDEQGDIAWRTRTTLWGTTTWTADATAHTPLRFPGQYHDPESGLHYNLNRHYDPTTGRYVSPDPLGLLPSPNPVAYVSNPQGWVDPLGLAACRSGTVWDDIKGTQPNYPGTDLPKSFEMQAGDARVWVHGNATKHMDEYARGRMNELVGPDHVRQINQQQLRSLQSAVAEASRDGVPLGRMVEVGGWELKFSQRPEDPLPALIHGLYKG
ncbi:putative T7SS-secreted protein [Streptomyces sp. HNM0574]|uniref:putative T7SS-secreted protein n=1 Tax=Streptomyces sp. HNM0574 TaxID=2714954 RepID=UPI00146BC81A|nr:DUF6531 domain-containing protein [Streptomyces sp. HNM0574]NLU66684.1 type IV secretion protein Rhs [Streptomyces sp. HNM0574]